MKEAREGHRGQHALALGEGLVQSAVQPSGKGGGLGWAPWSFGSLPFRESFLGQQPKSRPLQAGMLGNTGEQRALRSVSLRGLWGRSRDQRSGFQECSWMDCFLVGRENSEDCLLLQENSAVGLFPVSLEPAWGGGGEGGGCQAHVCTGQATSKQSQGGGQGALVPLPHGCLFQRNRDPPTSDSPHTTRRHGNGRACNGAYTPITCYRPSVRVWRRGTGDGATETPGLLSEALFQRVWSSAWSLGGRVIHPS